VHYIQVGWWVVDYPCALSSRNLKGWQFTASRIQYIYVRRSHNKFIKVPAFGLGVMGIAAVSEPYRSFSIPCNTFTIIEIEN